MFFTAVLTIDKEWRCPRCPPANEWMIEQWHTYMIHYYLVTKKMKLRNFQANGWNWEQSL